MSNIVKSRRLLGTVAVALVVGVGSAAGVGFAQDGGSKPAASTSVSSTHPATDVLAGIHDGLAGLVASGTIDQQQADAVQSQADAGSIDPKTLVSSGVVSDSQMRAIAQVIDQVKQAGG
jgi:hypothetical protein